MTKPCDKCDVWWQGRYYLDQPCDACEGQGFHPNGDRCWECRGAGNPVCPTCGGTGVCEIEDTQREEEDVACIPRCADGQA